jgi:hypothetical protein
VLLEEGADAAPGLGGCVGVDSDPADERDTIAKYRGVCSSRWSFMKECPTPGYSLMSWSIPSPSSSRFQAGRQRPHPS